MRFGVIGWGLRASIAKMAHQPGKGHRLVALADPDLAVHAAFQEFAGDGAQVFTDFESLKSLDLDAIFVLSPDYLHEEHAVNLLQSKIPIYLEKPMAITIEGCDRILRTAAETGTKLYLGHNMRHFAVIRQMRECIQSGMIGEVKTAWCRHFVSYGGDAYFCDWHADRSKSTGLLLQKGAHDIDVLHWLCNGYTKRVVAMGNNMVYGNVPNRRPEGSEMRAQFRYSWPPTEITELNPVLDVEDVSMMLMELDNGVLATYQQCHFTPDSVRNYTVIGTHGRIENFGDTPGKSVIRIWNRPRYGYEEPADIEFRPAEERGGHGGSDTRIIEEFLRYIEHGGETDTSPLAARMSVAAGVCATHSLRNGSVPVDVPAVG